MALKTINDLTGLATPAATDLVGVWAVGAARMRKSTIDQVVAASTVMALLAGRSGGQTIYGGTGAGDDLYLRPTSNATKGDVIVDQGNLCIGTDSPAGKSTINDVLDSSSSGGNGLDIAIARGNSGGSQSTKAINVSIPSIGTNANSLKSYGLYVDDIASFAGVNTGTDNFGIYIKGGFINYLAGSLGIGTIPDARLDIADGAFQFSEMTAPSSGAANTGRVFLRDNGSGKSQLCVIFATGAIQVLATEP